MELDTLLSWVNSYRQQKLNEEGIIKSLLQQELEQLTELCDSVDLDQENIVTVWQWNCYIIKKCVSIGLFCSFSQVNSWMQQFGHPIFIYTDEEGRDQSFYFGLKYKISKNDQMEDLISSDCSEFQQVSLDIELLHAQDQQLSQRIAILEEK